MKIKYCSWCGDEVKEDIITRLFSDRKLCDSCLRFSEDIVQHNRKVASRLIGSFKESFYNNFHDKTDVPYFMPQFDLGTTNNSGGTDGRDEGKDSKDKRTGRTKPDYFG